MAAIFRLNEAGCIEITEMAMRELARTHIQEGLGVRASLAQLLEMCPAAKHDQHFQTMYCSVYARIRIAMMSTVYSK